MKGDFSRVTFDPRNHFSQVLLQQGRVTLDADPNEQGAILLHYFRTLARDLFGPFGGPVDDLGFALHLDVADHKWTLVIGAGRYYVNGILCEAEGCDYLNQPHHTPSARDTECGGDPLREWLENRGDGAGEFWLYLDVWERHITAIEHPSIAEVALGGPDTCTRSQVIWQVRSLTRAAIETMLEQRRDAILGRLAQSQSAVERARLQTLLHRIEDGMERWRNDPRQACVVPLLAIARDNLPELAARIELGRRIDDPCITSPDSRYRGAENHLYRVEIHQERTNGRPATFKWSRDNGSVVSRWLGAAGAQLTVANSRGFSAGQWVELTNDENDLSGKAGPLFRIASVDSDQLTVEGSPLWIADACNPKLRRWDQNDYGDVRLDAGAVPVTESSAANPNWIDLEDALQIRFAPGGEYRSGDYWLIPARVATGALEWPQDSSGNGLLQMPGGNHHHYAPLGLIGDNAQAEDRVHSCLCAVYPASTCGLLEGRIRQDGVMPKDGLAEPLKPVSVRLPSGADAASERKKRPGR